MATQFARIKRRIELLSEKKIDMTNNDQSIQDNDQSIQDNDQSIQDNDQSIQDNDQQELNDVVSNEAESLEDAEDSKINIIITVSDRSRKASVLLPAHATVSQFISNVIERWNLPKNINYEIRLSRTGEILPLERQFKDFDLQNEELLVIIPILDAGASAQAGPSATAEVSDESSESIQFHAPVILPNQDNLAVLLVRADLIYQLEENRSDQRRWESVMYAFIGAILGIIVNWVTSETSIITRSSFMILGIFIFISIIAGNAARIHCKRAERMKRSILEGSTKNF